MDQNINVSYVTGNVYMPFQEEIVSVGKIEGNQMIMMKVKLTGLVVYAKSR